MKKSSYFKPKNQKKTPENDLSHDELLVNVDKCLDHLNSSIKANIQTQQYYIDLNKSTNPVRAKKIKEIYQTISTSLANQIYFENLKEDLNKIQYDESIQRLYVRLIEKITTKVAYYILNQNYFPFLTNFITQLIKKAQICIRRLPNIKDLNLFFEILSKIYEENKIIEQKLYSFLIDKGYLMSIEEYYRINGIDIEHRDIFNRISQQNQSEESDHQEVLPIIQENKDFYQKKIVGKKNDKKTYNNDVSHMLNKKQLINQKILESSKKQKINNAKINQINNQIKTRFVSLLLNLVEGQNQPKQKKNINNQTVQLPTNSHNSIQRQTSNHRISTFHTKTTIKSFCSKQFSKILDNINSKKQINVLKTMKTFETQIYQLVQRRDTIPRKNATQRKDNNNIKLKRKTYGDQRQQSVLLRRSLLSKNSLQTQSYRNDLFQEDLFDTMTKQFSKNGSVLNINDFLVNVLKENKQNSQNNGKISYMIHKEPDENHSKKIKKKTNKLFSNNVILKKIPESNSQEQSKQLIRQLNDFITFQLSNKFNKTNNFNKNVLLFSEGNNPIKNSKKQLEEYYHEWRQKTQNDSISNLGSRQLSSKRKMKSREQQTKEDKQYRFFNRKETEIISQNQKKNSELQSILNIRSKNSNDKLNKPLRVKTKQNLRTQITNNMTYWPDSNANTQTNIQNNIYDINNVKIKKKSVKKMDKIKTEIFHHYESNHNVYQIFDRNRRTLIIH